MEKLSLSIFDDLERKAADPEVKLMLLCNPHNPAGRVWSKQELCQSERFVFVMGDSHCR